MAERLEIINSTGLELQKQIKAIVWSKYVEFGWVKIKISDGKPTLVTVEKTDRID